MKVAILSESEADEAAIRVLVEGLLGKQTEPPAHMLPIRSRGYGAVFKVLRTVIRHLHYRTDAEGFVVVLDSDRTPVHQEPHDQPGEAEEHCRLCRLRTVTAEVLGQLAPRSAYGPLKTAFGLAVPQIEAWYLIGRDPHVGEAGWRLGLQSGRFPYRSDVLKQKVYGMAHPALGLEKQRAVEEAQRIVREGKWPQLAVWFPAGFGALASDVRSW
jgi:hypothetical protein